MIKNYISKLVGKQGARFVFAGAWNTAFGYLTFMVLYFLFSKSIHYMIILVVSTVVSITQAYLCHKIFVFKTRGNVLKEYLKFNSVYGLTAALNFIFLPLSVNVLHWHPIFAQGFFIVPTACFSYFAHKSFSFKRRSAVQVS